MLMNLDGFTKPSEALDGIVSTARGKRKFFRVGEGVANIGGAGYVAVTAEKFGANCTVIH